MRRPAPPRPLVLLLLACALFRSAPPADSKPAAIRVPGEDFERTLEDLEASIKEAGRDLAKYEAQVAQGQTCYDHPADNPACNLLLDSTIKSMLERLDSDLKKAKDNPERQEFLKADMKDTIWRMWKSKEDTVRNIKAQLEKWQKVAADAKKDAKKEETGTDSQENETVSSQPKNDGAKKPRHGGRAADSLSSDDPRWGSRGATLDNQETKGALGDRERATANRSVQSAKTAAEGLKRSLDINEDFDGGTNRSSAMGSLKSQDSGAGSAKLSATGSPGSGAASRGTGDPSRPSSDQDLLLAAGSYREAYQRLGLQAGTGPDGRPRIQRLDGSPASESDKARLALEIRREPSALMRDPDYFDPARGGIARDEFYALKETYRTATDRRDTDFKHIELSPPEEDRDFTFSEPCDAVSWECNPHFETDYSKGQDVPARGLKRISDSLRGKLAAAGEKGRGFSQSPQDAKRGRLSSRIDSFISGFVSRARWGRPESENGTGGFPAGPRTGGREPGASEPFSAAVRPGADQPARDGASLEAREAANAQLAGSALPDHRSLFMLLLGTATLILLLIAARRRNED